MDQEQENVLNELEQVHDRITEIQQHPMVANFASDEYLDEAKESIDAAIGDIIQ